MKIGHFHINVPEIQRQPYLKCQVYLHILLSPEIIKDTFGIDDISGPPKLKNRITIVKPI